jgi:hypothetical protein
MLRPLIPFKIEDELVGDIDQLARKIRRKQLKYMYPDRRSPYAIDINDRMMVVGPGRHSIFQSDGPSFVADTFIGDEGSTIETIPSTPIKRRGSMPELFTAPETGVGTPVKPVSLSQIIKDRDYQVERLEKISNKLADVGISEEKRLELIGRKTVLLEDIDKKDEQIRLMKAEPPRISDLMEQRDNLDEQIRSHEARSGEPQTPNKANKEAKILKKLKRDRATINDEILKLKESSASLRKLDILKKVQDEKDEEKAKRERIEKEKEQLEKEKAEREQAAKSGADRERIIVAELDRVSAHPEKYRYYNIATGDIIYLGTNLDHVSQNLWHRAKIDVNQKQLKAKNVNYWEDDSKDPAFIIYKPMAVDSSRVRTFIADSLAKRKKI